MSQKRTSSKIKQKQIETKMLQQQTKKMQQKLAALKQQVEQQKKLKQSMNYQSTVNKWKKVINPDAPMKDYAKKVLADRKQALNKYGIDQKKILGSKSFQPALNKLRSQKKQQQQKDPTKLPKFQVTSIIDSKKIISVQPSSLQINSRQDFFSKAKINTKQLIHRKNLQQFLQENFLHQYIPALKSNNINDLEDLYHLTKDKMSELGIKPGHQAKIIKKLKQQFEGKKQTNTTDNSQNKTQKTQQKVSFGYGDGDINDYKQINEQEQKQKIKNQLKNDQINQKYNIVQNQQQIQSQQNEQQDEDQVILTIPQMAQFSLQTNQPQYNHQQIEQQFNCFQCYRKTNNYDHQSSDGRKFCSSPCLNKYLQFMQKKCPECQQIFYKFNGYFEDGLWFCSLKCSPNHQKIQQMFIQWRVHNKNQQI